MTIRMFQFFLTILLSITLPACISSSSCNTILRLHPRYKGVGIFAERDFSAGEVIAFEPMIAIHMNFSHRSMIDNYASSSWDTPQYDNLIFGTGVVYNHHPQPNVMYTRSMIPLQGPNDLTRYVFFAAKEIKKGSEMFISYGTDLWFAHRNIEMVTPPDEISESELLNMPRLPGCTRSTIFFSNGNVYTSERIVEGEVIEVNRAIVIPGHVGIGNDLEEYVWFREGYNNVKGSLLIFGLGALYNTSSSEPNVMYSWYNPAIDSLDPEDHRRDVKCSLSMLVMFVATRDIEANEMLTVPLIRDSTRITMREDDGDELLHPRPRKYRSVRRKLVYDEYLPGNCF